MENPSGATIFTVSGTFRSAGRTTRGAKIEERKHKTATKAALVKMRFKDVPPLRGPVYNSYILDIKLIMNSLEGQTTNGVEPDEVKSRVE